MKRKMMIIDDDRCILESFEALFGDEYELILSQSANRALEVLKSKDPSLIFLDILLPGVNGLELLDAIKRMGKDSKIVLITASEEAYKDSIGTAEVCCLKKPFDIRELRKIASDALNGSGCALLQ